MRSAITPLAHMGSAAVAAPSGFAGREVAGHGLRELAAWAEGRPSLSAAEVHMREKEQNLRLLRDILGEEGLRQYLLGRYAQPTFAAYPFQPPHQPYPYYHPMMYQPYAPPMYPPMYPPAPMAYPAPYLQQAPMPAYYQAAPPAVQPTMQSIPSIPRFEPVDRYEPKPFATKPPLRAPAFADSFGRDSFKSGAPVRPTFNNRFGETSFTPEPPVAAPAFGSEFGESTFTPEPPTTTPTFDNTFGATSFSPEPPATPTFDNTFEQSIGTPKLERTSPISLERPAEVVPPAPVSTALEAAF